MKNKKIEVLYFTVYLSCIMAKCKMVFSIRVDFSRI